MSVIAVDVFMASDYWHKPSGAAVLEVVTVGADSDDGNSVGPETKGEFARDVHLAVNIPDTVPVKIGRGGFVVIVSYSDPDGDAARMAEHIRLRRPVVDPVSGSIGATIGTPVNIHGGGGGGGGTP